MTTKMTLIHTPGHKDNKPRLKMMIMIRTEAPSTTRIAMETTEMSLLEVHVQVWMLMVLSLDRSRRVTADLHMLLLLQKSAGQCNTQTRTLL